MEQKTIKEWLEAKLPKDIAERAIKNAIPSQLNKLKNEREALIQAFIWDSSPERMEYWYAVNMKYFLMKDDTIVPEPANAVKIEPAKEEEPFKIATVEIEFRKFENKTETIVNIKGTSQVEAIGIIRNALNQIEHALLKQ